MTAPLTVGTLYEALRPRLHLEWIAGRLGGAHEVDLEQGQHSGSSLAGPLNFVRPCQVPVLGRTELAYLDALESNSRRDAIDRLVDKPSEIVIIGDGQTAPGDLRKRAEAAGVPLFQSQLDSQDIVTDLQYYLSHHFAEKTTIHGVFMEVMGIGVLITGDASIGKSELALELVSRGHRLIADDSPVFARIAPDLVNGTCPEVLRDFLEVRGLGILNIRAMFGDSAIKQSKYMRLIIHLAQMSDEELSAIDRLKGSRESCDVLGVAVPQVTLPVGPGRNLAVLVEVAARNHMLYLKGYDASRTFVDRQQAQIKRNST
jgi:HPr kinase/phosphorylase